MMKPRHRAAILKVICLLAVHLPFVGASSKGDSWSSQVTTFTEHGGAISEKLSFQIPQGDRPTGDVTYKDPKRNRTLTVKEGERQRRCKEILKRTQPIKIPFTELTNVLGYVETFNAKYEDGSQLFNSIHLSSSKRDDLLKVVGQNILIRNDVKYDKFLVELIMFDYNSDNALELLTKGGKLHTDTDTLVNDQGNTNGLRIFEKNLVVPIVALGMQKDKNHGTVFCHTKGGDSLQPLWDPASRVGIYWDEHELTKDTVTPLLFHAGPQAHPGSVYNRRYFLQIHINNEICNEQARKKLKSSFPGAGPSRAFTMITPQLATETKQADRDRYEQMVKDKVPEIKKNEIVEDVAMEFLNPMVQSHTARDKFLEKVRTKRERERTSREPKRPADDAVEPVRKRKMAIDETKRSDRVRGVFRRIIGTFEKLAGRPA